MTELDSRSVGELLLECDLIVRDVLMDITAMDARSMVRTWGEVIEAAGDLWQSLPQPAERLGTTRRLDDGQVLMNQLQSRNTALTKATRGRPWPGDGPADERPRRVSENLTRATGLLPLRTDIRPMRPEVRADLEAAKARLMHVLYIGAHGVQVALTRDLRHLAATPTSRRAGVTAEITSRTVEARDRMAAFEQLTGSYVSRTFPAALNGEHKPPPEPDRLRQALASWDIQAHRALTGTASATTAATMALTAQTQAHTAFATQAILSAATATGAIDAHQYRTRLEPTLESLQHGWVGLAKTWAQLTPSRERRLDPDLGQAANEIRAALREILYDRTVLASTDTLAETVDLPRAAQTLQLGLANSSDLAYAFRDAAADPQLLGSARGINALAMALHAPGHHGNASTQTWVRPEDHTQDRPIALPAIVRGALTRATDEVVHAGTRAAGAAAFIAQPRNIIHTHTSRGEPTSVARREHRCPVREPAAMRSPRRG